MHWKRKAAIQNLLGRLPPNVGNPIYYQLQARFGGLRQPAPLLLSRLNAGIEMVRRLQRFGRSAESDAFLEVGTGHQLALPLSLWLCGASNITTVDLNRYLQENLVINDLDYLRRHEQEVRSLFSGVAREPEFEKRLQRLISGIRNLRELFALTRIRYWAPADAGNLALATNSVDCHVSFTVLEHIPTAVLKRIFREGCRVLKPNGLFIHYIDFTDHFAHTDDAIPSINFLQFSESEWKDLAGNRYMFHNRLRVDEFADLLLDLNLRIRAFDSKVDQAAADLLRKGFPLFERFRSKDSNTNAAKEAWMVASPA